jgi:hypothetical protein
MYLTAVIRSCERGLDAHANTEVGNILPQKARRWLAPESSTTLN